MKRCSQISRRALFCTAGAVSLVAPAADRERSADRGWTRLRRVVTSEDSSDRPVVIADGEPGNVVELNGTRISRLWESSGVPVQLPLLEGAGLSAGNAYRSGFEGTSFYIAEIPGGNRAPSIPMHNNMTLDYMAILAGKVAFLLPDREIVLRAGDTLVQGGNYHTWVNRWNETCLLLFVVVSGNKQKTIA